MIVCLTVYLLARYYANTIDWNLMKKARKDGSWSHLDPLK